MYQGQCLLEGAPAVLRMLFRIQPDIVCIDFGRVDTNQLHALEAPIVDRIGMFGRPNR
jgi:hypothetical protein